MTVRTDSEALRGKLVVLIGGSGFFGRHVAQELLARGARLRIASRNPRRAFAIKPLGNLGQVQFTGIDVTKSKHLGLLLEGAHAVVNLAGAFKGNLDALQGKGAGRIAAVAKAAGATAFVHVSALGADAESPIDYARTKAEGETAVLGAFPTATILRPSVLFGGDDSFVNLSAGLIATLPAVPVFGPAAQFQPCFVDDAAEAVAAALVDSAAHGGKTFELVGPETITMGDLNRRIAAAQGRKRWFAELPDAVSGVIATLTGWLPLAPLTSDQWQLLKAGSIASGKLPGFKALGIAPRPLDLFLDRWMTRYRHHGRFGGTSAA